jgi:hypothetical protein
MEPDFILDIAGRRRVLFDKVVSEWKGKGELMALTLDQSDKDSIKAVVAEVSQKVG